MEKELKDKIMTFFGRGLVQVVLYITTASALLFFVEILIFSGCGGLLDIFRNTVMELLMNILKASPVLFIASIFLFLPGFMYLGIKFLERCGICFFLIIASVWYIRRPDRKIIFRELFSTLLCWNNIWIILLPLVLKSISLNFVVGYQMFVLIGGYAVWRIIWWFYVTLGSNGASSSVEPE